MAATAIQTVAETSRIPRIMRRHAATLPHSAVLALQGLRLRNGRTVGQGTAS